MLPCCLQSAETGIGDTNHYSYPMKAEKASKARQSAGDGNGPIAAGQVRAWLPGQGHGSLGGFSMLNISEWPNDAAVCSLSQILEAEPIPQEYYLSAEACQGIIRRADKRGKQLPELLALALREVADSEQTSR